MTIETKYNIGNEVWVQTHTGVGWTYVRFEEYAHWYDQQGFDIHDVTPLATDCFT